MTIYTFPTLSIGNPPNFQMKQISNTKVFKSPETNSVQTLGMGSPQWAMSFAYEKLTEADAILLQSLLIKLRGQANRFRLWNMGRPTPYGIATGTPLVRGASQTGTSLIIDGWTSGVTGILKAGDFFGVNDELKYVTADANSDGSGIATINFEPPLRSSPADNAPITLTKPTAIMMLTNSEIQWGVTPPIKTNISIECIEVWT